jgi:hypothetical protein
MNIHEQIRERVIEAIEEIHFGKRLPYGDIMVSLGDVQQVYAQLKSGKRFPIFQHIVSLNTEYKYSFDWLLLGKSPKRISAEMSPLERIEEIEQEIKRLKEVLKT